MSKPLASYMENYGQRSLSEDKGLMTKSYCFQCKDKNYFSNNQKDL